jgi:hypothetical protein
MHADPLDAEPSFRPHRRRALLAAAVACVAALSLGLATPRAAAAARPLQAATATFTVVTLPAGSEAGWAFTLVGPGTPAGGEKLFTTGPGPTTFTTKLAPGLYTIAQTTLAGWDQTGASGCVFTVAYPADAGRTFACTVTDTREGHVTLTATHGGQPPHGADVFPFTLSGGPGAVHVQQVANAADTGSLDFGQLPPGTYTLCQQAPPSGWSTTLVAQGGAPNPAGDICLPFTLAPGQARAFNVDTTSPAPSTPTPTPSPTPTPGQVVTLPATGSAAGAVAVPNTGAGAWALIGAPLLVAGLALVAWGRRQAR